MPRPLSSGLRTALILTGLLSVACAAPGPDGRSALVLEALPSPTAEPVSAPRLATSDTRAVVSWLQQTDGVRTLAFAERVGARWSEPRRVVSGENLVDNAADVPSLYLLSNARLAAQWLERIGSGPDAYELWLAFSDDDGLTWSDPVRPHQDDTATQHGFASFFPLPDAGFGVVWLDGRTTFPRQLEDRGDMALWTATFDAAGSQTSERALDDRVCDCCQTAAAVTSDAVIVAYRDRSPREVRDVAVTRFENGAWTLPAPVHEDNWTISGCPVNGPAIDADGNRVAVTWFTGTTGFGQIFVAFSEDGGRTFQSPVQVDDGRPRGRVSVVLDAGGAFVSWTEALGGTSEFRVRHVSPDGNRGESLTVGAVDSAQYPRMASAGEELFFAWLDREGGSAHLRTARGIREP